MRIDLLSLLQRIDHYVLIKRWHGFPDYSPGADVDLLVFDRHESLRAICAYYEGAFAEEGELKVRDASDHCHVDFVFDGRLELRVDLISDFEFFRNIEVKPAFVTKVFMNRRTVACGDGQVYVPSDEDDLTLRYFEYLEWFDRRGDKIKHLDYIRAVDDDDLKRRFFANTHRYIQFKRKVWTGPVPAPDRRPRPADQGPKSGTEAVHMIWRCLRYLIAAAMRKAASCYRRLG